MPTLIPFCSAYKKKMSPMPMRARNAATKVKCD
ncbi:MAG: hypothetical protein FD177_2433 [Desulfovibrionaceae bacterium]|nr:MAG: hypothetical protein FD177_2433 [Desulfovibrionaceae bacterium]